MWIGLFLCNLGLSWLKTHYVLLTFIVRSNSFFHSDREYNWLSWQTHHFLQCTIVLKRLPQHIRHPGHTEGIHTLLSFTTPAFVSPRLLLPRDSIPALKWPSPSTEMIEKFRVFFDEWVFRTPWGAIALLEKTSQHCEDYLQGQLRVRLITIEGKG